MAEVIFSNLTIWKTLATSVYDSYYKVEILFHILTGYIDSIPGY